MDFEMDDEMMEQMRKAEEIVKKKK